MRTVKRAVGMYAVITDDGDYLRAFGGILEGSAEQFMALAEVVLSGAVSGLTKFKRCAVSPNYVPPGADRPHDWAFWSPRNSARPVVIEDDEAVRWARQTVDLLTQEIG